MITNQITIDAINSRPFRIGRRCLHLAGQEYQVRKASLAFPFLEPAQLQQFIDLLPARDETTILRGFVAWVRKNGWTE